MTLPGITLTSGQRRYASRDRENRRGAAPDIAQPRFAEFIRKPRIKRSRNVRPTLENSQAACNFARVLYIYISVGYICLEIIFHPQLART